MGDRVINLSEMPWTKIAVLSHLLPQLLQRLNAFSSNIRFQSRFYVIDVSMRACIVSELLYSESAFFGCYYLIFFSHYLLLFYGF
jgi:hypothetical protein